MNNQMTFALAYTTDENKIASALQKGRIDAGDMVLVLDSTDDNFGNLVIINKDTEQVKVSTSIRKFETEQAATEWLDRIVNKPVGEIISISKNGIYMPYMVNVDSSGAYVFTAVNGSASGVISINGQTGTVQLTTDDIPDGVDTKRFTNEDKTKLDNAVSKNGDTMNGSLDMNEHSITNVQKIHIDGEAPIYIGSTIEPDGTKAGRITGTTDGEISFVKADTQNTLTNINVAEPTNGTHAATKQYVDKAVESAGGVPPATIADAGKLVIVKADGTYGLSDNIDAGVIN